MCIQITYMYIHIYIYTIYIYVHAHKYRYMCVYIKQYIHTVVYVQTYIRPKGSMTSHIEILKSKWLLAEGLSTEVCSPLCWVRGDHDGEACS